MVAIKALVTLASFLVATGNAHMILKTPPPFTPARQDPLDPSGANFPCAGASTAPAEPATYAIGEEQTLSFIGGATHSGGSCQVSLTEDKAPTASSSWKVIHSIMGGCPSNFDGNLSNDPLDEGSTDFKFKVPDSIAPGEYTLAWTWFNRTGNREMYMHCAPITVTGNKKRYAPGSPVDKRSLIPLAKRADFPEMFKANIGNGCVTEPVRKMDLRFPYPGDSVEMAGTPGNMLPEGTDICQEGGNGPDDGSGGSSGGGDGGAGGDDGVFVPPTDGGDKEEPKPQPPKEEPEPPKQDPPAGGDGSAKSGACTKPGEFNCIGGTQYQQCASGSWSAAQPVAPGTSCTGGGDTLQMAKRSHRRAAH